MSIEEVWWCGSLINLSLVHIIVMFHHVSLLNKMLVTSSVDALEWFLLSVNFKVILQFVISQKAGITSGPIALIRLRVRVLLVNVQINVILSLRGKLTVGPVALEQLLASMQGSVNGQATVCLKVGLTARPITAEWAILRVRLFVVP